MKNKTFSVMSLLVAAAAYSGVPLLAHAQDATTTAPAVAPTPAPMELSDSDAWKFGVTIPAWFPGINGNVKVAGHEINTDVNNSELRNHLDSSIGIALKASYDKFGLFTDVGYMKFSGNPIMVVDGARIERNYGLKFVVGNVGGSYVLYKSDGDHPLILTGTAGIRYWYTSSSIGIFGPEGSNLSFQGGKDRGIVDPVIGLRATQYIIDKLHVDVAGDFGGFGVNNNIDTTWSASALASYDFTSWFTLSAGFKALAINEQDTHTGVNETFYGFLAAATFTF
jgi:hypothetical protein